MLSGSKMRHRLSDLDRTPGVFLTCPLQGCCGMTIHTYTYILYNIYVYEYVNVYVFVSAVVHSLSMLHTVTILAQG